MTIIYGTHRFGLKKTGACNDFCNCCEKECLSEEWQSFNCGHVFFIPVLPLGTKKKWKCALCGNDPRGRYKTSKFMQVLGVIFLPIMFAPAVLIAWRRFVSPAPSGELEPMTSVYVVGGIFGAVWLSLVHSVFFAKKSSAKEDERRGAVVPLDTAKCHYCQGALSPGPEIRCVPCGVRVYGTRT